MNQKYLAAYAIGPEKDTAMCIRATPENISAFLVRHSDAPLVRMETLAGDYFLLDARLGFPQRCFDQKYLRESLLPVLCPMQTGEREVPEIEYIEPGGQVLEDWSPLPDWNAWREYGISDAEFPGFREELLADTEYGENEEEMER